MCAAIWLQLTLVACYLLIAIASALIAKNGPSSSIYHTWSYSLTLVFLNSSLNPGDSLLLEDKRSQTISEEHNQTSTLPLFFELAFLDQNDKYVLL